MLALHRISEYAAVSIQRKEHIMAKNKNENFRKVMISVIVLLLVVSMVAYYVITIFSPSGS